MSQPFVGQITIFAGNFAPAGWMTCEGQLLPISEYDALFTLLGTTYGGDGQSTFGLPDLRGRAPLHVGQGQNLSNYTIGQNGGNETVILTTQQLPTHSHPVLAINAPATANTPANALLSNEGGADKAKVSLYAPFDVTPANMTTLLPSSLSIVGGSQPHENLQPLLVLNFIISLFGIFPTQS